MSVLSIKNLDKSYFGKAVLKKLNLTVNDGDRIALIGHNGCGKSTLLKIIAGLEEKDGSEGEMILASGTVVAYLSQQLEEITGYQDILSDQHLDHLKKEIETLEQNMLTTNQKDLSQMLQAYNHKLDAFTSSGGYGFNYEMAQMLQGLGLSLETLNKNEKNLSGGERMRVGLVRVLLKKPDLLLLDEPTNHLDIAALEWLENYLKTLKGTVIFVSHDRNFIDQVATATAEISFGTLSLRKGNYSAFKEAQSVEADYGKKHALHLEKEIERHQGIKQTMLSHRKMNLYHSYEKKIDKLKQELKDLKIEQKEKQLQLKFVPVELHGKKNRVLLSAKNIAMNYGEQKLFSNFSYDFITTDKICLCGPNGCGKSTLLAILTGEIPANQGEIFYAENFKFAQMGQEVKFPNEQLKLLDEVRRHQEEWTETEARNQLAQYGFYGTDVFKKICDLSGGERSRLYLCCLLNKNPDMIFLDEPTNHLDIRSREILEKEIKQFKGAVIVISHDIYFIEQCTQKILGFEQHQIKGFENYQSYRISQLQQKKEVPAKKLAKKPEVANKLPVEENISLEIEISKDLLEKASWLDKLNQRSKNKSLERKKRVQIEEKMKEIELKIYQLEEAKEIKEEAFKTATQNHVYEEYAQILENIEMNYQIYLCLEELKHKKAMNSI